MKLFISALSALLFTSSVAVACPAQAPSTSGIDFQADDKRVNAAWLNATLAGKQVRFQDGSERYNDDGSYTYQSGGQSWDAPSYRFYDNGYRCINYANPRLDLYVVNEGRLILINSSGRRFHGRIRN